VEDLSFYWIIIIIITYVWRCKIVTSEVLNIIWTLITYITLHFFFLLLILSICLSVSLLFMFIGLVAWFK